MKRLDVRITDRARALIEEFLSAYEAGSVIGLNYGEFKTYTILGVEKNETVARWRFLALTKAQADEIDRQSEVLGAEGLYSLDGMTVCPFESQDVERLRGKTLDAERENYSFGRAASGTMISVKAIPSSFDVERVP